MIQGTYLRLGKAKSALQCVERVLGCWATSTPNYSRLLALYSVGLFENDFFHEAEQVAGRSLSLSTDNICATRAVATVCIE